MAIHPAAIISDEAIIDESTDIGPFVIVEDGVKIGKDNRIMAGAFIGQNTTIGNGNEIHMGAVLGHIPQDISYKGEKSYLTIGDNNVIREHVTIHRSSVEGGCTKIGSNCLLMGGCHIAHDCKVGENVIVANLAGIAGHVEIGDRAFISGGSMIHQFVKIGRVAILSGNSRLSMDVPPFVIAGERNQTWGINVVGLRRAGFSSATIRELKELYRLFFRSSLPRPQILEKIHAHSFSCPEVQEFIAFVENSRRGICRSLAEKMQR